MQSGVVLLQVLDEVFKGTVDWKKANKSPGTVFKQLENCGLAIETVRKQGIKMVGVEGRDIHAKTPKFVLTMCWQLWRAHIGDLLGKLNGTGKRPDDKDIIAWANAKVSSGGYDTRIKDFKDKSLADSKFLAHLLESVSKGSVDFDILTAGGSDEELKSNSEYLISVARKIGCTIFNLPEDITEVRPKMMMTLVSMVMLTDSNLGAKP